MSNKCNGTFDEKRYQGLVVGLGPVVDLSLYSCNDQILAGNI